MPVPTFAALPDAWILLDVSTNVPLQVPNLPDPELVSHSGQLGMNSHLQRHPKPSSHCASDSKDTATRLRINLPCRPLFSPQSNLQSAQGFSNSP